jgi:para-aminobenzoate synthetase / 4-amino-4-deoxychorismate lyase
VSPFILLDDARSGRATLYSEPVEIVRADRIEEVPAALDRLRGQEAVGFLAYEAGGAFEPRVAATRAPDTPYLWFGLFARAEEVEPVAWLPEPAAAWAGRPVPLVARDAYLARVAAAKAAIVAGDIYQANISFPAEVPVAGDPRALYAGLRARAGASWGALIFTGADWILSLSPELFFTLEGETLTARPMKGTAPAGADPEALRADPKQRAENLMIVDLLRNDLSRVAVPGSVAVPRLFEVERYPTVQQMVSTVTARLAPGRDGIDALAALFPCGSITGAPKIRAMQLIDEIEDRPRGIYTGAIGRLDRRGGAAFNVAIRTLHLKPGADRAVMGLGSGIVADSDPAAEWRECVAKGAFVASQNRFDLIETIAFDPRDGLLRLERHLSRMKASADQFGFAFNRHAARNELQAATFRLRGRSRVRLLASAGGSLSIEVRALPEAGDMPVEVVLAPLPVPTSDWRLRHKTTDRAFYDDARRAAHAFEVIFTDAEGFLTEGSFTNIFVPRGELLLTPPLARGLLPGVLRGELIESGRAIEAELTPLDLQQDFFIGNSARGLLRARLRPV